MRIGSLFSGIGGLELGLEWAGIGHTVWQVEQDEYCRRVLERHWPEAARFSDVRAVGAHNLPSVDLICGGFPCQDVSAAGKGAGLAGERSGLWFEFARIIDETSPRIIVVENVTSGASRWVGPVSSQLGRLGYETLPVPLSASAVGAPHLRRRLFLVSVAADPERIQLWQQQGGRSGKRGQGETIVRDDGAERAVGHSDGERQLQPKGGEPNVRRRVIDSGWWAAEPKLGRVAHGIPARSHRLRALGNAVVPQCAEVVGYLILELMNESKNPND